MDLNFIISFFGWCVILNFSILLFWVGMLFFAKNLYFKLTNLIFDIDDKTLFETHYKLMGFYKLSVYLLFVVPYFALKIIS